MSYICVVTMGQIRKKNEIGCSPEREGIFLDKKQSCYKVLKNHKE